MGIMNFFKKEPRSEQKKGLNENLTFEFEREIPKYIKKNNDLVSMCNVWHHFKPNSIGEEQTYLVFEEPKFAALVWGGMSKEYLQALDNLTSQKRIFRVPISIDVYVLDCETRLNFPILPTTIEEVDMSKLYFYPHALTTSSSVADTIEKQPRATTYALVYPGGKVVEGQNIW